MKKIINFYEFCDEFGEDRRNQFSYNGKKALFEYLEQCEEEIELDIVAICCEYTEYATAIECARNYFDFTLSDADISAEEAEEEALEYLRNKAQIIEFEGGIIRKSKAKTDLIIRKQEEELLTKTKIYAIEINNKEIKVKKTWIDDLTYSRNDVNYEVESEDGLTKEERDELIDFMVGLE